MVRIPRTVLAWLAGGISLWGGTFQVSPVRIEMSARRPNARLAIQNSGSDPVTIQVQAVSWTAKGNGDQQTATDDLIVNPPVFTMGPGQTQHLRIGLREPKMRPMEICYRLILVELPSSSKPLPNQIRTLLRLSLPVFIQPPTPASHRLVWTLASQSENQRVLRVENTGSAHVQFTQMGLADGQQAEPEKMEKTSVYVLPGGSHEWKIRDQRILACPAVLVKTVTDKGEIRAVVRQDNP